MKYNFINIFLKIIEFLYKIIKICEDIGKAVQCLNTLFLLLQPFLVPILKIRN
uniref:Uncharacterized protein n=1 Tax=Meloidogyne enterolobii TaxID=390850 RepID=A0A6V7WFI2_MELEN|nr:unnamed protein product [Meloidogyne enterolobii]